MRLRPSASVLALSLDQLTAWGVLYYAYTVLSAHIARDLPTSRRFVAGAFSFTLLLSGGLARPVGRALDRVGSRSVLLAGAGVGAVAFGGLAAARDEITLLLAFAALGVAQALALYEPAFRAVVDWYPADRERSRALLVLTSIAGFASTVFLPFTTFLVDRFGWRPAVGSLALVLCIVTLPIRLALGPTRRATTCAGAEAPGARGIAASLLGWGFALQSFASTGTMIYLVWHLVERGEPVVRASVLAGLAGAAQVPGRLLLAPIQRAMRTGLRLPLLFVLQAGALGGIALGSGALASAAIAIFGATSGMMTLERAAITVAWFGRENFGARSGHIASIGLVARAASPYAVEWMHGRASYAGAFGALAACLLAGAIVIVVANRHLGISCT